MPFAEMEQYSASGLGIGGGATILGNIEVGVGAKIGAGSVVPGVTVNQSMPEFDYVI